MADDGSGKVAWYDVIRENMKDIKDDVREIKNMQKKQDDKLNAICVEIGKHENSIADNHDEIDRLRASSNRWDSITGLGALIAAILATLGLTKS